MWHSRTIRRLIIGQLVISLPLVSVCHCWLLGRTCCSVIAAPAVRSASLAKKCPHCRGNTAPQNQPGQGQPKSPGCCCADKALATVVQPASPVAEPTFLAAWAVMPEALATAGTDQGWRSECFAPGASPPLPTLRSQHVCLQI